MVNAEKKEFTVRLLISVHAESETDAVDEFIENLNKFGLRSWVYMVEDNRSKDLFQVTGVGEVKRVDPSQFVSR